MAWHVFFLQFVSGLLLANGVPHFVHGISGRRFQSPFAKPPGVGESSPLVNVVWGFANLAAGFALLWRFAPNASTGGLGWLLVGTGALVMGIVLAWHFGRVHRQN